MTLQVLPPELLEAPKDKIETKEPHPTGNLAHLKMENLKSSDCLAVTKPDTQLLVGNMLPKYGTLSQVICVLTATSLLVLTLGNLTTSLVKPTGLNLIVPRSTVLL